MHPLRILLRWSLTLVAIVLVTLAVLTLNLRIEPWRFSDDSRLVALLGLPDDVQLSFDHLSLGLRGHELELQLDDLGLIQPAGASRRRLLELDRLTLRLDLWRSLRLRQPAISWLDADGVAVRLYQRADGRWWQADEAQEGDGFKLDFATLDRLLDNLQGSRARVTRARVDFYALDGHRRLELPRAELASDGEGRVALELSAALAGSRQPGLTVQALLPHDRQLPIQAYLHLDANQATSIASLFSQQFDYRFDADGSIDAWATWERGAPTDLRLALELPSLEVGRTDDAERHLALSQVSLALALGYRDGGWHGAFDRLAGLDEHGAALTLPRFGSLSGGDRSLSLALPQFRAESVNLIWPLLPLSEGLRQTLADLSPKGEVAGAQLDLDLGEGLALRDRLRIRAAARQAEISSHDEIPAIGPVDGWVDTTLRRGWARLKSDQPLRFSLPTVFSRDWRLDTLSGRLDWTLNEDGQALSGSELSFTRDGATADGQFSLSLPDDDRNQFTLELGLRDAVLRDASDWVPMRKLGPELGEWLERNLRGGEVPEGRFGLSLIFGHPRGRPELEHRIDFDDPDEPSELQLELAVREATLGYLEGWPPITRLDGSFKLDGTEMEGRIDRAELAGLESRGGSFSLHDDLLSVEGPVSGDASALLEILKAAPFDDQALNQQFAQWQASGPLDGEVKLEVPFEGQGAGNVRLEASGRVRGGSATLTQKQLSFDDIDARVRFLLQGERLSLSGGGDGRAFDGPVEGSVDVADGQGGVDFSGSADAARVLDWLGLAGLVPDISGRTDYQGRLSMVPAGPVDLELTSTLEGVELPLPSPLGKRPDEAAPLRLVMNVSDGEGEVEIDSRLKVRWRNELEDGQVWIQQWPRQPQWDAGDGWSLHWVAPRLAPLEWKDAIARIDSDRIGKQPSEEGGTSAQQGVKIRRAALVTECLELQGRCMGPISIDADHVGEAWHAQVESDLARGQVSWDPVSGRPIEAHFSEVDLDPLLVLIPQSLESEPDESARFFEQVLAVPGPPTRLAPLPQALTGLPSGFISIDRLQARGREGALELGWRTSDHSLDIDRLRIALAGSMLEGELHWSRAGEASVTRGMLTLNHRDFGDLLELLGQPKVLSTPGGGRISASFAWPGAPWQPSWATATGKLGLDIGDGSFTAIESTSARLVGLLNFDNLLRRLRLDFTDLTRSGTSFNSIRGSANLSDGVLTSNGPVLISAPATNFSIDGQVNLVQRTLNQRLGVTLPVSQSLPLAALLAGAPQVGGVLLLFHWAFGGWIDKVTELHYRIEGPWAEPNFRMESAR
ncbi:YhdP family phospholipid transporter [Halotalea alkalilenta]|uniref:YhdP central domain-containing protein n=1 Tax=Halotalea alkalilenta TaxID=376489 RepID=A0A172YE80_9GAMM|nr:AsmA-like C-terminal region-containing protein [Halotalea alkalilenta]ANF57507.1 hypothetical protein A5892_08535 [Halotalea alkalilenta]